MKVLLRQAGTLSFRAARVSIYEGELTILAYNCFAYSYVKMFIREAFSKLEERNKKLEALKGLFER